MLTPAALAASTSIVSCSGTGTVLPPEALAASSGTAEIRSLAASSGIAKT